jgi:hypothetical protein
MEKNKGKQKKQSRVSDGVSQFSYSLLIVFYINFWIILLVDPNLVKKITCSENFRIGHHYSLSFNMNKLSIVFLKTDCRK